MTTSEREFETLSAVMDNEADELELRRVLDAASSDPALRARWRRQQMVRELLQTRRVNQPNIEVSSAVTEALTGEKSAYRNPLWSMAVAASVTMALVLGGQQLLVPKTSVMQGSVVSDLVGGVVPVLGAQPVQASLGARSLPVADRQVDSVDNERREVAALYERLAQDRYRNLARHHASRAAPMHPAPYISYVRAPAASGEKSAHQ
ncbi:RseA family anti-sigma factor [Luminiphilus sp.]|nr:RseA family anti-sigma factor [Luminiphilus sp.]